MPKENPKPPKIEDLSYIRKWIKRCLSKDGKTLDFSSRGIDNQVAMELAENVALPDIEILYLHTNKIKDMGLEELAQAELFSPLHELWLYENLIRDDGARALAESEQLKKLRYLSLYTNRVADDGAVALAESETLCNLETLDLSFNRVGDRGACALANAKNLKKIKKYFSKNFQPYVIGKIINGKKNIDLNGKIKW